MEPDLPSPEEKSPRHARASSLHALDRKGVDHMLIISPNQKQHQEA